jgi:IclR family KDG regulon transcriptional repressor
MIPARNAKSAPVGVIGKILRIFEALKVSPAGLSLRDISLQTGLNKSTAYRFLAHLERERYLFRDEAGFYVVGPKLIGLASGATYQTVLRKVCRPILQRLWRMTDETVNLGILDGQQVYYLDVLQSPHPFRMASHPGSWRPVYCTAMGKALSAYLPPDEKEHVLSTLRFERFTPHTIAQLPKMRKELEKIRQAGYAIDDEEAIQGARCVAAPILLENGKAAAALSVSGPTTRIDRAKIPLFVAAVREAARAISVRLGASQLLPAANGSPASQARPAPITVAAAAGYGRGVVAPSRANPGSSAIRK